MKKSTAKAAKPATPAKKAPAKTAPAKVVNKPASAPVKSVASTKSPVPPKSVAPTKSAAPAKAPVVKPAAEKQPATTITALINVGFGSALYLRGEGPSLSWDVGVALDCIADDKWSITLPGTGKPVTYKFLINDITWSQGPDYVVESGSSVTVVPSF